MVGQGSPANASAHAPRFRRIFGPLRSLRRTLALCVSLLITFASGSPQVFAADPDPLVHVRIAWGTPPLERPRRWVGSVSLTRGTMSVDHPLGTDADDPGSMWVADGAVQIRQRTPHANDGVDLTIRGPLDSILSVQLKDAADPNGAPTTTEVAIGDIVVKPFNKELDKTSRLLIRRVPGDALRVAFRRDNLVFSPNDSAEFDVEPSQLPTAANGASLLLRARLMSAGKELAAQDQNFKAGDSGALLHFEFKVPPTEGVYDLLLSAYEPPALRFNKPKLLAERRVQMIVISDQATEPPTEAATTWTHVMEIDPANPRWFERFKALSLLPALSQGTISNADVQTLQHSLGTFMKLNAANGPGLEPQWQAFPLTIGRTGAPHIVEVEYPSDVPQSLGISIVEPNAAGFVIPVGLDSGVYVEDDASQTSPRFLKHRLLFWPHTKNPVLLISNQRDNSKAVFGKIHVLAGPANLPRANFVGVYPAERLIAGFMQRPFIAENFGAPEALDDGRSLKDWQTFYDGASRLTEYLGHIGYGGQIITVMAEGSSIYPSAYTEATPLFDNGVLLEQGQDPVRKDVLEVMFRMFDRAGLRLIPSLQFDAPLPELEDCLRKNGADAVGVALIGPDGKSYVEANSARRGIGPYYNPLNPRVQTAMLSVVRELIARYQQHQSFAGLSIELTADGFAQLPGTGWALDDETIAQFQHDTKITVPGDGPNRFAERAAFLVDPDHEDSAPRQAWLEWRANKLATFYRTILQELAAARRDSVLYLSPTNLFDGSEAKALVRPPLPPVDRQEEVLLTMGIRSESFRDDRGLVLLRPFHQSAPDSLAVQGSEMELNRNSGLDARLRAFNSSGALLFHEPRKMRLPSFDSRNPFGKDKSRMSLISQMSPSNRANRQGFIHALATTDAEALFDGGWMVPLGQEDSLSDLVATYRRLPAAKFKTAAEVRPVTVRTLPATNCTYAYIVNDSAWPTTVKLQLDMPPGCRIEELSGRRRLPILAGNTWTLPLDAYDLVAVRFSTSDVRVTQADVEFDQNLKTMLNQRVHDLQARVTAVVEPTELPRLLNNNFELPAKGVQIPGWTLTNAKSGSAVLGPEGKSTKPIGKQAVKLECTNQTVSLNSEFFPSPATGRLSISMWLRVDDANQQPRVVMALREQHGDKEPRWQEVGQNSPKIPNEWSQFIFAIDNLPTANLDKVQFQLYVIGAGSVWIDDVQLYDLKFSEQEQRQLSRLVALADLQLNKGKLGDCLEAVDSYWLRFLSTYVNLPQQQLIAPAPAQPAPNANGDAAPTVKSATKPSGPIEWFREKMR
jgi:hypothetical protein